jgi:hypothetical protein
MTAGLYALGDGGAVQFDDTYINYTLVQRNTVTISSSSNHYGSVVITYDGGTAPIIAWAGDVYASCPSIAYNNGQWQFTLYAYCPNNAPVTFSYYIFDRTMPPNNNYGMQIFNSDGTLMYDAVVSQPLRISGISGSDAFSGEATTYLDGNRQYAVTNLNAPAGALTFIIGFVPVLVGFVNYVKGLTGQTKSCSYSTRDDYPVPTGGNSNSTYYNRYGTYLIIDVTNY